MNSRGDAAGESVLGAVQSRSVEYRGFARPSLAEARLLSEVRDWARLAALEFRYSYLRPVVQADFRDQVAAAKQLFDFARNYQLTVVAYSVLLNGAYSRADRELPLEYQGPDTGTRLSMLRAVADEVNATTNQVLIAWLLQCSESTIPIIGGSTCAQIRENIAAADLRLTAEQVKRSGDAGAPAHHYSSATEPAP